MHFPFKSVITTGIVFCLNGFLFAGPTEIPVEQVPPASNPGNWCEWLQNKPGMVYKNSANPYIQELQFEGRFQYQYGHLRGSDINGTGYDEDYDDVRRFRLGVNVKFLQYFAAKYQANVSKDSRHSGGGLDWGYDSIDVAYLSFDLAKALGNTDMDKLSLIYGRQNFDFGTEGTTSSRHILTIERSALSNRAYGAHRPTGLTIQGEKGPLYLAASLYSSTTDGVSDQEFSGWQDDYSLLFNVGYKVNEELFLRTDFSYNHAEPTAEDSFLPYRWAVAVGAQYDAGPWGVTADVIYGDNGGSAYSRNPDRQGDFYGLQFTPWMWLVKDKLQLVGQYQYQGADAAEGIRINSRYGRAAVGPAINNGGGRGDSHHSVYGGLNYYLSGHHAKFQGGVEYQTLNAIGGDLDTVTYLLAFRTYF